MNDKAETKLTQREVNAICWRACDTFRGVIDANEYKDYILVMLFLKYISDVWQDRYDTYSKKYSDNKVRINRAMERERFVLPKGKDFYALYKARNADNIGEQIDIAIAAIEDANKAKLEGVFQNITFNTDRLGQTRERNSLLRKLLEDFADPRLDLRPSNIQEDVIGEAYMYLIERFGSDAGKKAGEFYTPACVRQVVATLADPEPRNLICDPTCGSGSLLFDTARILGGKNYRLFGQEKNGSTLALAKMNMFLHGIDDAVLEWGDTINNPRLLDGNGLMKFDRVVANPPFSLDKWGAENAASDPFNRFTRGIPPKSKGDWAFILHMIETAKNQSGRVVVVVPHGVLFRGASEGRIREQVLKENLLDAVIGLPEKLFSTASIPVALMVFDRRREKGGELEKRKDVLFVDASREFESGRNQNTLTDANIDRIIKAFSERKTIEKFSYLARPEEIEENDYNLNIPRYVDTFEEEEEIDLAEVQCEIDRLDRELYEIRDRLRSHLKGLGL
ncbi:MAG: type I restriction-modification system subunit M [Ectothiorhodospiraceae bacterium AqS1]|nr:type I restriction-modification system subunit M [Ectothiorhodospiraceae bacterium AqS1]